MRYTVATKVIERIQPGKCEHCKWHKYLLIALYNGYVYVWSDLSHEHPKNSDGLLKLVHIWKNGVNEPSCINEFKEVGYLKNALN